MLFSQAMLRIVSTYLINYTIIGKKLTWDAEEFHRYRAFYAHAWNINQAFVAFVLQGKVTFMKSSSVLLILL